MRGSDPSTRLPLRRRAPADRTARSLLHSLLDSRRCASIGEPRARTLSADWLAVTEVAARALWHRARCCQRLRAASRLRRTLLDGSPLRCACLSRRTVDRGPCARELRAGAAFKVRHRRLRVRANADAPPARDAGRVRALGRRARIRGRRHATAPDRRWRRLRRRTASPTSAQRWTPPGKADAGAGGWCTSRHRGWDARLRRTSPRFVGEGKPSSSRRGRREHVFLVERNSPCSVRSRTCTHVVATGASRRWTASARRSRLAG